MATDWTSYYQRVLANPTATATAKAEAQKALGYLSTPTPALQPAAVAGASYTNPSPAPAAVAGATYTKPVTNAAVAGASYTNPTPTPAAVAGATYTKPAITQNPTPATSDPNNTYMTSKGITTAPSSTPTPAQPAQPASTPTPAKTSSTSTTQTDYATRLDEMLKYFDETYKSSIERQETLLKSIGDKTSSDTLDRITQRQKSSQESLDAYFNEQNSLIDQIKNQPSAVQALQTFREQQGLPQMEKELANIDQTILTTETLLNNIEGDIRKRTEGLPVSEAAARRLTAMEQAPISKQLSEQLTARQRIAAGLTAKQNTVNEFMNAQKEDIARQREIINAKLGVSEKKYEATTNIADKVYEISTDLQNKLNEIDLKQLDLISNAADYKTKLLELGFNEYQQLRAEQIAQTDRGEDFQNELIKMKLEAELNKSDNIYSNEVVQNENGEFIAVSKNKNTGAVTFTNSGITGKTSGSGSYADIAGALYNVGLPSNIATTTGQMNKSYIDKLVSAGIPADTAQGIFNSIIQGSTLEEIRQYFRENGVNPIILDKFMTVLQGSSTSTSVTGQSTEREP